MGAYSIEDSIPETFIRNCYIIGRGDGTEKMFTIVNGVIYAHLDGYIIAPRDKYRVSKIDEEAP